jgi:hypothetical protein
MNCDSFINLIAEYLLNGENIPYDMRADFEKHFITCEDCWNALETQRIFFSVLEDDLDQIFQELEFDEMIDKAISYESDGNYIDAIRCYKIALIKSPEGSEIENKIQSLKKLLIMKNGELLNPPLTLFKNDIPIDKFIITSDPFSFSVDLVPPGSFKLVDNKGIIVMEEDLFVSPSDSEYAMESLSSPSLPKSRTINIVNQSDRTTLQLKLYLEYRKNKAILSISSS